MLKLLFSSLVVFLLTSTTFGAAATCTLMQSSQGKASLAHAQANFNQPVTLTVNGEVITFELRSVRVGIDSFDEYVAIEGYVDSNCKREILFDSKNIYNGVKSECSSPASGTIISCIYNQ